MAAALANRRGSRFANRSIQIHRPIMGEMKGTSMGRHPRESFVAIVLYLAVCVSGMPTLRAQEPRKETTEFPTKSAVATDIADPLPPTSPSNVLAEIDLQRDGGALIVPLMIQGRSFRFVLDTGATSTVFDQSLRSLLGAKRGWLTIDAGDTNMRIRLIDAPVLSLGSLRIELKKPALCMSLTTFRSALGAPIDGMLGLDALSEYVVRIDTAGKKLWLLRSVDDAPGAPLPLVQEPAYVGPFGAKFGAYYQTVSVSARLPDGQSQLFMIDTGMLGRYGVQLTSEVFDRLRKQSGITQLSGPVGFTSLSGMHSAETGVLANFTLGGYQHHRLAVLSNQSRNLIGLGYLERYVATFDFPVRQLYLRRSPRYEISDAAKTSVQGSPRRQIDECFDFNGVEGVLNHSIALNPNTAMAYLSRGNYWSSKSEFDKAIADFTEAIRLDADDPNGFYRRGQTKRQINKISEAISDFSAAIRIDPEWDEAYSQRAWLENHLGDYGSALKDYTRAIEIDPNWFYSYRERAWTWERKGNTGAAVKDYTEAIRLNPTDLRAYVRRGAIFAEAREQAKALADFKEVIEIDADSAEACYARGRLADMDGKHDQAMRDYQIALQRGFEFSPERRKQILAWRDKSAPRKMIRGRR